MFSTVYNTVYVYTIDGISLGQYRTICQCQKTIMRCMAGLQLNITRNHYMQLCVPVIMISCAACNELSRRMRWQLANFPESGVSLAEPAWLRDSQNRKEVAPLSLREEILPPGSPNGLPLSPTSVNCPPSVFRRRNSAAAVSSFVVSLKLSESQ